MIIICPDIFSVAGDKDIVIFSQELFFIDYSGVLKHIMYLEKINFVTSPYQSQRA